MRYNPNIHHRRTVRLPAYDYRQAGAYFVTICTEGRDCILDEPRIQDAVAKTWRAVGKYAPVASGDEFIVMPNHIHGIIWLNPENPPPKRAPGLPLRMSAITRYPIVEPGSLGAIVRAFKSASAKRVNALRSMPGAKVWQRDYHEHVIRDDGELNRIRQYIRDNPAKRDDDPNNPTNISPSAPA